MTQEHDEGHVWTGWPTRPALSLYADGGQVLVRSRSIRFDLADAVGHFFGVGLFAFHFGIHSDSTVLRKWTKQKIAAQESNIRYDLTHDGFDVMLACLKAPGLACREDAIWRLEITT